MCMCNSAMIVVFVSVLLVVCGSDLQGACAVVCRVLVVVCCVLVVVCHVLVAVC